MRTETLHDEECDPHLCSQIVFKEIFFFVPAEKKSSLTRPESKSPLSCLLTLYTISSLYYLKLVGGNVHNYSNHIKYK